MEQFKFTRMDLYCEGMIRPFTQPPLAFCFCQMLESDKCKLAKLMADGSKFPMELTTEVINTLEQLGLNNVNSENIRKKGQDNLSTQQIWTFSSNVKV